MTDADELTVDDLDLSDPGEEYEGADYDDTSFLASPIPASKSQTAKSQGAAKSAGSQAKTLQQSQKKPSSFSSGKPKTPPPNEHRPAADGATREAALRTELATLKTLNGQLAGVLESLSAARGSLDTVSSTVGQSGALLDTWTRMLAATEHNQRLLLNPRWHGASEDAAEMAADEARRDAERARKKEAEDRRRADRERKLEEDRMRREAEATVGTRGRPGHRRATSSVGGATRGTVTGVRGTRGGVRGGSATASGRGVSRTTSVGGSARARGASSTTRTRGRGV